MCYVPCASVCVFRVMPGFRNGETAVYGKLYKLNINEAVRTRCTTSPVSLKPSKCSFILSFKEHYFVNMNIMPQIRFWDFEKTLRTAWLLLIQLMPQSGRVCACVCLCCRWALRLWLRLVRCRRHRSTLYCFRSALEPRQRSTNILLPPARPPGC